MAPVAVPCFLFGVGRQGAGGCALRDAATLLYYMLCVLYLVSLGGTGLAGQDRCLLEITVGDLDTPSGEDQYYWRLAIRAARVDRRLTKMQVEGNAREYARRRRA